jgi:hypothetical protein
MAFWPRVCVMFQKIYDERLCGHSYSSAAFFKYCHMFSILLMCGQRFDNGRSSPGYGTQLISRGIGPPGTTVAIDARSSQVDKGGLSKVC